MKIIITKTVLLYLPRGILRAKIEKLEFSIQINAINNFKQIFKFVYLLREGQI